jgi:hypothetical protein
MSKRTVVITFEVDASEYHEAEDTAEGTVDLVLYMLRGNADLPDDIIINCEGIIRKPNDHLD